MKNYGKFENVKKIYQITYILISLYSGFHLLSDIAFKYTYKDELKVSPDVYSGIRCIDKIPFIFQPMIGYLIDVCLLFGSRRRIYIFISAFINIISLLILTFTNSTVFSLGILIFLIKFGVSLSLTVAEALTVELKNLEEYGKFGKAQDVISNYFLFKFIGEFITSFLKWYLIQVIPLKSIFLISSILPVFLIISGLLFDEKRIDKEIHSDLSIDNSQDLEILIDELTDDTSLSNIFPFEENISDKNEKSENDISKLPEFLKEEVETLPNSSIHNEKFKKICHIFKSKNFLIPMIFLLFYKTTPPIDEPKFYFFTNSLKLTPQQLGYVEIVSTFMSILAIISYKYFLKNFCPKKVFSYSILLNFFIGLLYIILVMRINIKLGIPDLVLIFLCDPFNSFIMKLVLMPLISAGCALCPKDIEGTVITCFYASMNLGSFLGDLIISLISKIFNLDNSNLSGLHWVILTCKFYSLIPVILILFINTDYFKPNDDFINETINETIKTEFSDKKDINNSRSEIQTKLFHSFFSKKQDYQFK